MEVNLGVDNSCICSNRNGTSDTICEHSTQDVSLMGWLNLKEQRRAKRKFKIQALYMCDHCHKPIPIYDFPVIDPKGGYHPWPLGVPTAAKCLSSQEPKVTYHLHPCNDELCGKRPMTFEYFKPFKKLRRSVRHAVKSVMRRVREKPRPGYWTKKKLVEKMEHHGETAVKKAIKFLRKEKQIRKKEGGYVARV